MRPKKVLLLVDDEEGVLALRKFSFMIWGYNVYWAETAEEAARCLVDYQVDVLLVSWDAKNIDGNAFVEAVKLTNPHLPTILVSNKILPGARPHSADAFLGEGCCSPTDLRQRVKVMAMRKRGPRKVIQIST